ncbi:MAG: cupredoxin domain-containing protein [Actinomycetota bacterium]|nr:cupredoxin domain-containing protein [Actinomycetota bacterium]
MDPEQIYQEVLSEEQAKGSSSAISEGRAKAARQRAIHGSPHPKEPRWWPGAQPQFEGGGNGAAPAAAAEPEAAEEAAPEPEAPAAEAPAAEAPAAEAPAAEAPAATPPDIGDEAQAERPEAPAPAPAAGTEAAQQAAPEPVAAPAAAAVAAPQRPTGVTHGTDTGNRLRPEDAVGTDAQFDAQKALAERRRLIDELVATGVPAATAEQTGQPKAPLLLLAYILIPLLAIFLLQQSSDGEADAGGGGSPGATAAPDGGPTTAVVAEGTKFDVETITLAAGEPASIDFENKDALQHNIAIYEDESASAEIFKGEIIEGGDSTTYEFEAPQPGEYYFRCDVHPDMNGTVVSE